VSELSFDTEAVFDEDYLYFYEQLLTPERTAGEVEVLWGALELAPGLEVLDLACGHGRIANALAERGCRVTGLDATPSFLELARRDAATRGVEVDYVEGDMRSLPWADRFDGIVCWFTSFGYFSDDENRRVLAQALDALKPGGLFAIDVHNRDKFARVFVPASVTERDGDLLVDEHEFDVLTGRVETERTVVRDGRSRRMHFSVRFFTFTELRDWLLAAGFEEVRGFDRATGEPLSSESRRMITVARKGNAAPTG
jgi:SAM-dependent methyltransferase